ncbi:chemotaxis protein methyltransferase CheR [Pseudanabaena sp. lw0831]|uniref:CheR family methyltransferase n=1 Tax=Pseudanabaena sp. lw0831 TaxID=1357935 RepID=UPI001915AD33|nr:CheR family methyltransferase [Pseudanabaena sp. lw0831]GBO53955.1 chemotaxis protein methyltransferase CheR [Pseudanabaena sp. lw0831]
MALVKITKLLSQTIGLDPDVVGLSQITRAVETRRVSCNLPDIDRYWTRLQTSAIELEELIELIIVPETWFFRDGKPFDYLKTYVNTEWRLKPNRNLLQLLSVPSSTGEEPYSIAISLLEAGLQPKQFTIDAIDISQRSLTKARRGIYTKNSFRGDAWQERSHYFQQNDQGYELSKSIRDLVNFQQGNVITTLATNQKQYDIIFCRNLLIYLKPEVCTQVLAAIDPLLVAGGLLFVGGSETGKIVPEQYSSIRQPFTFAYRKLELPPVPIKPSLNFSNPPQIPTTLDMQTIPKMHLSTISSAQSSPSLDLPVVRKLANEGKLIDATTLCKNYLEKYPTSADAYVLLGELYQADRQNPQASQKADQCFQRAIYLEPNSYEALIHLALLKESQGDTTGANIIRQRMSAIASRLPNSSLGGGT